METNIEAYGAYLDEIGIPKKFHIKIPKQIIQEIDFEPVKNSIK